MMGWTGRESPMRFTVAYNGSDDLYYLRAGWDHPDGERRSVIQPVTASTQRQGEFIEPMVGMTGQEAQNLAEALARAGFVASVSNASRNCEALPSNLPEITEPKPEKTYPESTVRAMRAHMRDLQRILFGEEGA